MDANEEAPSLELTVYRMVQTYVRSRAEARSGRNDESPGEAKEKIAKGAFLAIRSRYGEAFSEYFASTIASVPQWMSKEIYLQFSKELRAKPDEVRTLAMLALSAAAWSPKKEETEKA